MDETDMMIQLEKQEIVIKELGKTLAELRAKFNELDSFVRKEVWPKLNELNINCFI